MSLGGLFRCLCTYSVCHFRHAWQADSSSSMEPCTANVVLRLPIAGPEVRMELRL